MIEVDTWATIVKARVFMNDLLHKSHVLSSVWTGCKEVLEDLMQNSMWSIGKGNKINVWCDNWCGKPLVSMLQVPVVQWPLLKADLSSILCDNSFNLPSGLIRLYPDLPNLVSNIFMNYLSEDKLV
ncbi:unnamed protein product [Lathyrus sativus]|nr:unnamed protein product [Lathyrus sativus]